MISDENLKLREELSRVQALFEATERQNSETIVERTQAYQMMQGKDQMVFKFFFRFGLLIICVLITFVNVSMK